LATGLLLVPLVDIREALDMETVVDRVSQIVVARLNIDPSRVTETARFDTDLGATSLDMVEMIMSLEDEFKIEINDSAAEKFRTVGDVMAFIRSKAPSTPPPPTVASAPRP
jgi:acyl carrier protein